MRFVAQPFGLGDGENALVDPAGAKLGLSARRKRWCRRQGRLRGRRNRALGLLSLVPEVPGDRVLMPAAIVVGRSRDRRRVVRVEPGTGIGSGPTLEDATSEVASTVRS